MSAFIDETLNMSGPGRGDAQDELNTLMRETARFQAIWPLPLTHLRLGDAAHEQITIRDASAPEHRICSKRSSRRNGAAAGPGPGSAHALRGQATPRRGCRGRCLR